MKKEKKSDEFASVWLSVKAVIVKDDKILILRRSKKEDFHTGKWDLPGGHMDKNEGVTEALKREIKDETNLEVEIGEILALREYPRGHKMFNKIKALRFIAYHKSGKVKLSEEHDKFEWLTFDEALEKITAGNDGYENEKRETILMAKKHLEMKNSLDSWQRCLAEFDNYKKRQAEERKNTVKYATENIINQILPVLDNFSSSVEHIPEKEKNGAWVQGIMYIKKQLENVLKENGIDEIKVKVGDDFDEVIHEAIKQETKEKKLKNKISKIVLPGYKVDKKIIRPARVVVE